MLSRKSIKYIGFLFLLLACISWLSYFIFFKKVKPSLQKALEDSDLVPVLIIGSGPAGLSAALYTARAKLPTMVLTGDQPGGTLSDIREIENWPGKKKASGEDTIDDLADQAEHFGANLINDSAVNIDLSSWPFVVKTRDGKTLHVMTLILATGRIAKKLDIPGVEKYWGHGVGVCTICDAPFHKDHVVGVVGGGDTAGDRALQLAAFAKKVYMFVKDDQLDASGFVQDYLKKNEIIEILYNTELVTIEGNDNNVTNAEIYNNKTGKTKEIPLKGIYFAIGWHPNSDLVQNQIKLRKGGFIWVDGQTQHSSITAVFAAGDVADPLYGKAGVATGSGVKAGIDAIKFLQSIGFGPNIAEKHAEKLFKADQEKQRDVETVNNLSQLNTILRNTEQPVILDFYTDYCPSCKALLPHLKTFAEQYQGKVTFIKINYDNAKDVIQHFKVISVPYFIVVKDEKVINSSKKIKNKNDLEKIIIESLK